MLLKGFGFVKQAFQALLGFVTRHPWQAGLIAALALSAWLWRANNGLHDAIKAERARYAETVANFKDAQAKAELAQKANLARVSIQQRTITDETLDDYNRRVADLRGRYQRLLAQGNRSASGGADLPAIPDTSGRINEAPVENGLPAADALTASEQALQLDALITWIERQAKVETSE
jgi:hypothetical protein